MIGKVRHKSVKVAKALDNKRDQPNANLVL